MDNNKKPFKEVTDLDSWEWWIDLPYDEQSRETKEMYKDNNARKVGKLIRSQFRTSEERLLQAIFPNAKLKSIVYDDEK